jgi:hypothetical protein
MEIFANIQMDWILADTNLFFGPLLTNPKIAPNPAI